MSKVEDNFARELDKKGISYKREFKLGDYRYDFKIGDILVECNPSYTHNSTSHSVQNTFRNKKKKNGKGLNGIEQSYHRKKTINAINNDYRCIQMFDWVSPNEVIELILSNFKMEDTGSARMILFNKETKDTISNFDIEETKDYLDKGYLLFFDDGFNIIHFG